MKSTKKILSLLLVLAMVFSLAVPVFAEGESTQTYQKVTSATEDWSGTYLIVYETDSIIFDGSLNNLDVGHNVKEVSISDGVIVGDYAGSTFTIEAVDGGYAVKSASGLYMAGIKDSNKISAGSTAVANTISIDADGAVDIASNTSHLRFNNMAGDNNYRFRYYKSASYGNQQSISLYKLADTPAAEPSVEITDCGCWGEAWPNAYNLGWKYVDFDVTTITSITAGMKDAEGTLIVEYTADAEQIAWQQANGYVTEAGLSSAPFYQEYNGTAIAEGRDSDWTVTKGEAFAVWQPALFYVTVKTADAEYALSKDYSGPYATPVEVPEVKELDGKTVILHSNDVHGAIEGYANIAALKAEYEAKGAEVILADAGDYSQGTVNVSSTKGLDAIKMMNAAGYDVATIGNHEFDYGYEQLKTNAAAAEFKMICADVLEDGKTILDANVIIEKDGVKIGFFGLETPEAQTKANPALIKGLTFLAGDQLYACAQEQVAALKEQGADIVICLAHLGVDDESAPNRSVDLAAKVEGIDFIIDGHSHTVMTEGPNGEDIQSTGTAFKNVGVIVIDNASKKIESNDLIAITAETAKDETVAAAAKVIIDRINEEYGEVFAKSEVDLNGAKAPNGNRDSETNLGDLITDSMLWTVLKDEGSITVPEKNVIAITNGGGIRAPISKGDITKKDVNTVLPFGNTIAVVYVTGAELLEALEASTYCTPTAVGGFPQVAGIEFNIDTDKEYDANEDTYPGSTYHGPASINRVTVLSVNGMPFYLDETYAVVTNNFLAAGGDTYYAFSAASAQFDTGIPMDEALMAYITEELGGVVGEEYAEPQGRITIGHLHNFVNGICEDCGLEMEATFTDVKPGAWYFDSVEIAAAVGLVNGRTEDTFVPNANMTRAEFATILYRLAGEEEMGELKVSFKDIKGSEWYADTVLWAASWGLVNGYPDGTFKPNGTITRQEIAIMLMRFNDIVVETEETVDTSVLNDFADGAKVPDWSKEAMAWAVNEGIIHGMDGNKLAPTGLATRAQVATMVVRYLLTIDA